MLTGLHSTSPSFFPFTHSVYTESIICRDFSGIFFIFLFMFSFIPYFLDLTCGYRVVVRRKTIATAAEEKKLNNALLVVIRHRLDLARMDVRQQRILLLLDNR